MDNHFPETITIGKVTLVKDPIPRFFQTDIVSYRTQDRLIWLDVFETSNGRIDARLTCQNIGYISGHSSLVAMAVCSTLDVCSAEISRQVSCLMVSDTATRTTISGTLYQMSRILDTLKRMIINAKLVEG